MRLAATNLIGNAIGAATVPASSIRLQGNSENNSPSTTNVVMNWYVNGAEDPEEWAGIAARQLELKMNSR